MVDSQEATARPPELSVVLPVYNEVATVSELIHLVLALPLELEILAVDDGSTDGSAQVVADIAAQEPRLRLLVQAKNQGKGAAVRRGIKEARGTHVVIQDADLEYDPRDFLRMLYEMKTKNLQVLYGSRRLTGRSPSAMARYYWGGVLVTWATNLLYLSKLTDEPTCYKMWKRELIQSIPLNADGFEFCPEVTAKVLKRRIRIPEIQISYKPRSQEEGKKIRLRDGWIAIWTLLKYRFKA